MDRRRFDYSRSCATEVVNLHETFEDEHFVYLVMELCQGGELVTWRSMPKAARGDLSVICHYSSLVSSFYPMNQVASMTIVSLPLVRLWKCIWDRHTLGRT